jgi:hypothetical protein
MALVDAQKHYDPQGVDPTTGFVSAQDAKNAIAQIYTDMSNGVAWSTVPNWAALSTVTPLWIGKKVRVLEAIGILIAVYTGSDIGFGWQVSSESDTKIVPYLQTLPVEHREHCWALRKGNSITISGQAPYSIPDGSPVTHIFTIPDGWRPVDKRLYLPIQYDANASYFIGGNEGVTGDIRGGIYLEDLSETATDGILRISLSYVTDDAWPIVIPA